MEVKYIVAIIFGSLFLILFAAFIILKVIRHKKALKEQARIAEVYAADDLAKMEYDFAVYDEESTDLLDEKSVRTKHTTIDEELDAPPEEVFGKIDGEGIEEITGNYKPE